MFKKAYSTLEKAVSDMISDETNYPSSATGTDNNSITVPRGFNYTTATINGTVNKFCFLLADQLNTIGTVTCPVASEGGGALWGWNAGQDGTFTTTDGIYWRLYFRTDDTLPNNQFPLNSAWPSTTVAVYPDTVYIDVNGLSKGPNCTASTFASGFAPQCASTADCSSNPDIFIISVRYDGKLYVGGYHGQAYTDACANSILSNPTTNQ